MDQITLALAKKYTDDTAEGMGAVKGISPRASHTDITGGTRVTLTYYDDSEEIVKTDSFDVMDGEKGEQGDTPDMSSYYTKTEVDNKFNPTNNFKTINGTSIIGTGDIPISGGGGTTVVANPTLAGTEAELTGLQVGDTKYKVPTGGGGSYTLPTASASTKGGIKIGEGLSMDGEVLNADSEVYVGSVEPSDDKTKLWLDTSSSPSGSDALTLLWTNPDTGSAGHTFAGQTITVDLTNYTAIYVVAKIKAGYSSCVTQLCIKGITNRLFVGAYDNGVHFYDRLVAMTNSGVQFYDASSDGSTDNTVLFPLYIYGTK